MSASAPFGRFARRAANATWRDVDWARTLLAAHAGKTLRVEVWPLAVAGFTLRITPDGAWDDAAGADGQQADATLRLTPALIPRWAAAPDNSGAALDLAGEPALVRALRDLSDVLPLAIEERLTALIGPLAAHGVSSAMRALAAWPAHAAERIGAGLAAYLTEESATLLKRRTFDDFALDLAALARRVERMTAKSGAATWYRDP